METALRSGVEILAVLFSETGATHISRLQPWIPAEARLLRTDATASSPSPAERKRRKASPRWCARAPRPFDDLIRGIPLILVMAGVQDPGNVGTLVRTAEALGATGVAVCAAGEIGTANPFSPKALRASAGSALRLPIIRGIAAPVLLAQLRIAECVARCTRLPAKEVARWQRQRSKAARAMGDRLASGRSPCCR